MANSALALRLALLVGCRAQEGVHPRSSPSFNGELSTGFRLLVPWLAPNTVAGRAQVVPQGQVHSCPISLSPWVLTPCNQLCQGLIQGAGISNLGSGSGIPRYGVGSCLASSAEGTDLPAEPGHGLGKPAAPGSTPTAPAPHGHAKSGSPRATLRGANGPGVTIREGTSRLLAG